MQLDPTGVPPIPSACDTTSNTIITSIQCLAITKSICNHTISLAIPPAMTALLLHLSVRPRDDSWIFRLPQTATSRTLVKNDKFNPRPRTISAAYCVAERYTAGNGTELPAGRAAGETEAVSSGRLHQSFRHYHCSLPAAETNQ